MGQRRQNGARHNSHPHRRLAAAVVANAVEDLKRRPTSDIHKEAAAWLLGPLGGRWMCLLGFEPEAIREALQRKGML